MDWSLDWLVNFRACHLTEHKFLYLYDLWKELQVHKDIYIYFFWLSVCTLCFLHRFTEFGGAVPHRPAEDLAFSVARFIQKGGSFINYYMVSDSFCWFYQLNPNLGRFQLIFYCFVFMISVPWRNKFWQDCWWSFHCH